VAGGVAGAVSEGADTGVASGEVAVAAGAGAVSGAAGVDAAGAASGTAAGIILVGGSASPGRLTGTTGRGASGSGSGAGGQASTNIDLPTPNFFAPMIPRFSSASIMSLSEVLSVVKLLLSMLPTFRSPPKSFFSATRKLTT
jgi:hypothetical protein